MSIQHSQDIIKLKARCEDLEDKVKQLSRAVEALTTRKKPGPKPKLEGGDCG